MLGRASNARSETKIYNLETCEYVGNLHPPFSKKTFGGSYLAPHFWAGSLELLKLIFKFEIIFSLAKPYAILLLF